MKKLTAILLSVLLVFSLAACGNNQQATDTVERQIVANPNIKLNLSFFTLFPQIIPAFSSIPSDYS